VPSANPVVAVVEAAIVAAVSWLPVRLKRRSLCFDSFLLVLILLLLGRPETLVMIRAS